MTDIADMVHDLRNAMMGLVAGSEMAADGIREINRAVERTTKIAEDIAAKLQDGESAGR